MAPRLPETRQRGWRHRSLTYPRTCRAPSRCRARALADTSSRHTRLSISVLEHNVRFLGKITANHCNSENSRARPWPCCRVVTRPLSSSLPSPDLHMPCTSHLRPENRTWRDRPCGLGGGLLRPEAGQFPGPPPHDACPIGCGPKNPSVTLVRQEAPASACPRQLNFLKTQKIFLDPSTA